MRFGYLVLIALLSSALSAGTRSFAQVAPDQLPVKNLSPEEAQARVERYVLPVYPKSEKSAALTRTVEMGVEISPSGDISDLRVLRGAPALASSARDAVRQWTFAPAAAGDPPATARMRFLVRFRSDGRFEILAVRARAADSFGDTGAPQDEPNAASVLIYGLAKAGRDGIGYPSCDSCPEPSYTQAARVNHIQGVVVLEAIITAQGNATDFRVVRSLGYGLDEAAMEGVRKWRFKLVRDARGQPIDILTLIQITFRP